MNIKIDLFNPLTATKEAWNNYHNFRKLRHIETSQDPFQPNEIAEKTLNQNYNSGSFDYLHYAIIDSDLKEELNQIGLLVLRTFSEKSPSYKGNEHLAEFNVSLLPEYRKKGIGTKALAEIIGYCKDKNITVMISSTSESDGKEFLNHLGAKVALSSKENRLQMKDVNWTMVNDWIAEGEQLNPETKILLFTRIPDDLIDQYASFLTEIINQQPTGNIDINKRVATPETLREGEEKLKKIGNIGHILVTIEKNGQITGMTKILTQKNDKILNQSLTGVKEDQRGRKLGKWLKAAMLLEIRKNYPQITAISTGNVNSNAPMLSINNRLGFKPYKEFQTGQIELSTLEKYINQKVMVLQ